MHSEKFVLDVYKLHSVLQSHSLQWGTEFVGVGETEASKTLALTGRSAGLRNIGRGSTRSKRTENFRIWIPWTILMTTSRLWAIIHMSVLHTLQLSFPNLRTPRRQLRRLFLSLPRYLPSLKIYKPWKWLLR